MRACVRACVLVCVRTLIVVLTHLVFRVPHHEASCRHVRGVIGGEDCVFAAVDVPVMVVAYVWVGRRECLGFESCRQSRVTAGDEHEQRPARRHDCHAQEHHGFTAHDQVVLPHHDSERPRLVRDRLFPLLEAFVAPGTVRRNFSKTAMFLST